MQALLFLLLVGVVYGWDEFSLITAAQSAVENTNTPVLRRVHDYVANYTAEKQKQLRNSKWYPPFVNDIKGRWALYSMWAALVADRTQKSWFRSTKQTYSYGSGCAAADPSKVQGKQLPEALADMVTAYQKEGISEVDELETGLWIFNLILQIHDPFRCFQVENAKEGITIELRYNKTRNETFSTTVEEFFASGAGLSQTTWIMLRYNQSKPNIASKKYIFDYPRSNGTGSGADQDAKWAGTSRYYDWTSPDGANWFAKNTINIFRSLDLYSIKKDIPDVVKENDWNYICEEGCKILDDYFQLKEEWINKKLNDTEFQDAVGAITAGRMVQAGNRAARLLAVLNPEPQTSVGTVVVIVLVIVTVLLIIGGAVVAFTSKSAK